MIHGNISVLIGISTTNQADIQRKRGIKQEVLPVHIHQLHHITSLLPSQLVCFAAFHPGIGKGAQSDMGQYARFRSGDGAEQVDYHPEGQRVSRDFILAHHLRDDGRIGQVPGNQCPHQSGMRDAVKASVVLGIAARADSRHHSQARWTSCGIKPVSQRFKKCVRSAVCSKTAHRNGLPILNFRQRLLRGNKLRHFFHPFHTQSISFGINANGMPTEVGGHLAHGLLLW